MEHGVDWLSAAALVTALGLFVGLWYLRRRRVNFSIRTLVGLAAGIAVGLAFRDHVTWIDPIGTAYLNVLLAIVAPLIIISLLSSVMDLGTVAQLRAIGLRTVFWLSLSTLISILITLGLALSFEVGKGAGPALEATEDVSLEQVVTPFTTVFVNFFPTNIVGDIAEDNIIPIILFTLLIAVSYVLVAGRDAAKVKPFADFVIATKAVIFKAVGFVISLTPYAVLALTASAASRVANNAETFWSLIGMLAVAYLACFIHAYLVNGVLLRVWGNVNPLLFFRKFLPAQATAFTTQSSIGTLPVTTNMLTQRIGVPAEIAGFSAPLGATIGMPGCAGVWPVLVAIFGVNALGLDYGFADYLVLIVLGLLVSLGTAGVPGTATVTAATVLVAAGLPVELLALTLPISTVADMARTLANVTAAGVTSTIVARQEGRLDDAIFNDDERTPPPLNENELATTGENNR